MTQKRPYFRPTSAPQRRLLFETWQATGSIPHACERARVSIRTFYYWLPRFQDGGYAALDEARSHAPKNPRTIPPSVAKMIIELKQSRPTWGKLRIANEVVNSCDQISSLSPNTVRRVLEDAGLWHQRGS